MSMAVLNFYPAIFHVPLFSCLNLISLNVFIGFRLGLCISASIRTDHMFSSFYVIDERT